MEKEINIKTSDNTSPIIRTENLDRDFRTGREIVHALKQVNINIQPEKLTVLRGRSGSGKTVILSSNHLYAFILSFLSLL
jgi:putative ABC transport system ATP-binding protein